MKTPILRPPLEAILFGFERIGMVIRIAWFPIVIVMVMYLALAMAVYHASLGAGAIVIDGPDDIEAFFERADFIQHAGMLVTSFIGAILLAIVSALILAGVEVAIVRTATRADYEPPKLPIYFALGTREIRYFLAKLLYGLILSFAGSVLTGIGFVIAGLSAAAAAYLDGQVALLLAAPGAAICIWLVLVWFWIAARLLPLAPIAAVENRLSFGKAWDMTRGNFWRLLISGAFFYGILEGVLSIFALVILLPAIAITVLLTIMGAVVLGPAAVVIFLLLAVVLVPLIIAIIAFAVAAEAAFPGRIYAYLSGCGEDCKIY